MSKDNPYYISEELVQGRPAFVLRRRLDDHSVNYRYTLAELERYAETRRLDGRAVRDGSVTTYKKPEETSLTHRPFAKVRR